MKKRIYNGMRMAEVEVPPLKERIRLAAGFVGLFAVVIGWGLYGAGERLVEFVPRLFHPTTKLKRVS